MHGRRGEQHPGPPQLEGHPVEPRRTPDMPIPADLETPLLLLDEPLEGLAPIIVEELTEALRRMIADEGTAVMLIEQHAEVALSLTHDAVIIERGQIAHRAASAELLQDAATLDRLIGLNLT